MDLNVLLEYYVDTKLVKTLVPPQKRYNHQKGTNVLKTMDEKMANEFALGIVDEDVEDRQYAQLFDVVWYLPGSLKLLKHPQRHHFLIYLCPAIEKWIITCAEEAKIVLTTYNLPHDFNKLRKLSKTSKSENDDLHSSDFQQLSREIKRRNPPVIAILTFWIGHLKENPYATDLEWLIEETNRLKSA